MNENTEMWRQIRKDGQDKRWNNLKRTTTILDDAGIPYKKLSEMHFRIFGFGFWPTTGKFINRETKREGRGVYNLIKETKKV